MSESKNEFEMFTSEEYVCAFRLVMPYERAVEEAQHIASTASGDPEFPHARLLLSPDILYLLSLVSDDCAMRARQLAAIPPDEFAKHQAEWRRRIVENGSA